MYDNCSATWWVSESAMQTCYWEAFSDFVWRRETRLVFLQWLLTRWLKFCFLQRRACRLVWGLTHHLITYLTVAFSVGRCAQRHIWSIATGCGTPLAVLFHSLYYLRCVRHSASVRLTPLLFSEDVCTVSCSKWCSRAISIHFLGELTGGDETSVAFDRSLVDWQPDATLLLCSSVGCESSDFVCTTAVSCVSGTAVDILSPPIFSQFNWNIPHASNALTVLLLENASLSTMRFKRLGKTRLSTLL